MNNKVLDLHFSYNSRIFATLIIAIKFNFVYGDITNRLKYEAHQRERKNDKIHYFIISYSTREAKRKVLNWLNFSLSRRFALEISHLISC